MADCVTIVIDAFVEAGGLKNVRNQQLYIHKTTDTWPRAVQSLDDGRQRVDLPSDGDACAQAIYYLGHELGHVVSGFERR
jgi:hypothetical protein